jgi:hypothetical protein
MVVTGGDGPHTVTMDDTMPGVESEELAGITVPRLQFADIPERVRS